MADHSFPFGIDDVVNILGLSRQNMRNDHFQVNCPFCFGKNGQPDQHHHMDINTRKDTFHCNRCDIGGGMLALYAQYHHTSIKTAYSEIMATLFDSDKPKRKRTPSPQMIPCEPEPQLADIETLDNTYRHLLQALQLSVSHTQALTQRGLSLAQIQKNDYRSLPAIGQSKIVDHLLNQGCTLQGVPGFYAVDSKWKLDIRYSGLLIPIRDYKLRIQRLQIRRDHYVNSKYNWLTSSDRPDGISASSCIHLVGLEYAQQDKTVYLTEGPLKADVASFLSKKCFIACPGTSHYKRFADIIPILKWYGIHCVYNAFDMDFLENPQVASHIQNANALLMTAGFGVKRLIWPTVYKGIDDYLLACTPICR